jgi:hypothetical protein
VLGAYVSRRLESSPDGSESQPLSPEHPRAARWLQPACAGRIRAPALGNSKVHTDEALCRTRASLAATMRAYSV